MMMVVISRLMRLSVSCEVPLVGLRVTRRRIMRQRLRVMKECPVCYRSLMAIYEDIAETGADAVYIGIRCYVKD